MGATGRQWGANVVAVVVAVALTAALNGCRHGQIPSVAVPPDSTQDAYHGSVAALMWPGATRAYQITAAGDLFNGAWAVRVEPGSDGVVAGPPSRIAYEDRWCPVARWTRLSGTTRWEFEAVAFPEPEPAPWSSRGALARFAAAHERGLKPETVLVRRSTLEDVFLRLTGRSLID